MASTHFHLLPRPNPLLLNHHSQQTPSKPFHFPLSSPSKRPIPIKCSSSTSSSPEPDPDFPSPDPSFTTLNSPETFPIEKRRRSEIVRKSRRKIVKPEPPNFEIGWKRTKEIVVEKPIGWTIMDFLEKLEGLMEREFGSTELLAKVGEIVAERAREEAEILREDGKVEERMVTELFRVLRLMEMDLAMVKAAKKEETMSERLIQAKARCRQAIIVANSF